MSNAQDGGEEKSECRISNTQFKPNLTVIDSEAEMTWEQYLANIEPTHTHGPPSVKQKTPETQSEQINTGSYTDRMLNGAILRQHEENQDAEEEKDIISESVHTKNEDNQDTVKEEDEKEAAQEHENAQDNKGIVMLCSRDVSVCCCCCILIILLGITAFCLRGDVSGGAGGAASLGPPLRDRSNVTILTSSPSAAQSAIGHITDSLQHKIEKEKELNSAVLKALNESDQSEVAAAEVAENTIEQAEKEGGAKNVLAAAERAVAGAEANSSKSRRLQTLDDAEVGTESTGSKLTSLQSVLSIATVILIVVLQSIYLIYRH